MSTRRNVERAAIERAVNTGKLDIFADAIEEKFPKLADFIRPRTLNLGRPANDNTKENHAHLARFVRRYWELLEQTDGEPDDKERACEMARLEFETLPDGTTLHPNVAKNIAILRKRSDIHPLGNGPFPRNVTREHRA